MNKSLLDKDFISQIIKKKISKKELLELLSEDEISHINDVTVFNITLDQSSSQTLNEVVIQVEMNKENTNTLFVMQKNNASVSDVLLFYCFIF